MPIRASIPRSAAKCGRYLLPPLLLLCAASGAQAAICRAAPTASGAANGATWADAMTLQAALGNSGCDEIWLQQGLYKPGTQRDATFAINRPLQLYGGFVGGETARGQRATNSRLTVLSGDIDNDDTTDANGIVLDANDQGGANSYNVVFLRINPANPALTRANTIIDGLTITAGRATGGGTYSGGGGLRCNAQGSECSPTLRNITFSGNYASSGGAIYTSGNNGIASPLISHATFTGNVSGGSGGAIYNSVDGTGSGSPNIEQSTFSGNRAGQRGGAIFNIGSLQPGIAFSTFHGNTATFQAGAIASTNNAQPTITASVFSLNTAAGAAKQILDESSGTRNFDGNLVQGGGCGVGVLVPSGTCTGSPLTSDPLLGTLQDHGGPTWTMLPGASSPALGAATCGAGDTDQRGAARPTGACAMGAVEPQATAPDTPSSLSASTNQVRQITLTWGASNRAVDYEVKEGTTTVCRTSATTCVVTGLADGQNYSFTITAANESGSSGASPSIAGATLALPGAPQNVTATPGDASVRIAWAPPVSGGSPTGYTVTMDSSPTACTASPCTFTSLANGTSLSFIVAATNAAGTMPAAAVPATPATLSIANVALPGGAEHAQVDIGGNPPGCVLSAPVTIDSNAPAGAPAGATYPLGVLRFTVSDCAGATLAVRVSYPAGRLAGLRPYKYGPPQAGDPAAWFAHGAISGDSVTYTVQDDGTGDNDTTTPGVIADPFMPLALAAGAVAIPTLSQWALLLLGVLTAGLGAQTVRRRPR